MIFFFVFETIKSLRNLRQSLNIPISSIINIDIIASEDEKSIFNSITSYIHKLAKVNDIQFIDNEIQSPKQSASCVVFNSKIIVPLAGLIDLEQEINRQNKKLDKVLNEKKSLQARMNNDKFVSNAPKDVLDQTKSRIQELNAIQENIEQLISVLK